MHTKLEDISHDIYQKTQQNKTPNRTLIEHYQLVDKESTMNPFFPTRFLPKTLSRKRDLCLVRATFHLTISMRGQRATGKIQRNNYHHGNCGPSLTDKTSSVSLIFTHRTHRNIKNR